MPQVPLQTLQLFQGAHPRLGFLGAEAFRDLIHHRQTHTHVKPVEQMFGLGIQIELQFSNRIAAVGEKSDLLVHLHPLGFQHFEYSPLRFRVITVDQAKTLRLAFSRHTLANDHLKAPVFFPFLLTGIHIAAIDPDCQRHVWPRQFLPISLTTLDEEGLSVPIRKNVTVSPTFLYDAPSSLFTEVSRVSLTQLN